MKALSRSVERLASGHRTLSARDNAASIAIASRLTSTLRGTTQALLNINQGQALLYTADGALAAQQDITQRIRELAARASNGTLSSQDRVILNDEFQRLLDEIDQIAKTTRFNGIHPLEKNGTTLKIQVGADKFNTITLNTPDSLLTTVFDADIDETTLSYGGFYDPTVNIATDTSNLGTYPFGSAVGDLDNDGDLDYIYNSRDEALNYIYLNNGSGTFSLGSTYSAVNTVRFWDFKIADVDGDGDKDIVSIDSSATGDFQVKFNNGSGTFSTTTTLSTSIGSGGRRTLQLGDVDNDGDIDAMVNRQSGEIGILLNNGSGVFALSTSFNTGGDSRPMRVGDFDGDGNLDIATALIDTNILAFYFGNGSGSFSVGTTIAGFSGQLAVGDVNNDGRDDLVFGNISTVLGRADRALTTSAGGLFNGVNSNDLDLFDFNNDGILDIGGLQTSTSELEILLGIGDGTFSGLTTFGFVGGPQRFNSGDFNMDGQVDFIVQTNTVDGLAIATSHAIATTLTTSQLQNLHILTQESAEAVLGILPTIFDSLNSKRAQIGSQLSRLESAANSAGILRENLSAAKSSIEDLDFVEELAEFTRLKILSDVAQAVLAQANLQRKLVLELLKS